MLTLTIFNIILLIIISGLLVLVRKTVKGEIGQRILLLSSALVTILFHYSSFIFLCISGGDAIEYLWETPNLILPIYPCNVVMWSALILALIKDKNSRSARLFYDYVFWFGILSTLVGMFANVDFIRNPTLKDYEITKSIVAHATLLFNVLLLPLFGRVRFRFLGNMINMAISVFAMFVIGHYCNLVFRVLVSDEKAYDVNSMFLIHSPFDGVSFMIYPVIAGIGLLLYCALFLALDTVKIEKGDRFIDKVRTILDNFKKQGNG